jgi:hypothetical protein
MGLHQSSGACAGGTAGCVKQVGFQWDFVIVFLDIAGSIRYNCLTVVYSVILDGGKYEKGIVIGEGCRLSWKKRRDY